MSLIPDYPGYFDVLTPKRIVIWQVLGAFFLAIGATSCGYSPLVHICIPNIVFWVNVLSGPFTGAHLNAMITMSWVFKSGQKPKLPALFVVTYILAQCVGATLGGFVLYFMHNEINAPSVKYEGQEWIRRDMISETLISAMYCCICHIISKKSVTFVQGQYQTWIIASVGVFFARQYSIHSGGCMNPSLAVGLNFAKLIVEGYSTNMQYTYVYVVSPIVGSLLGTLFFDYFYCRYLPGRKIV